MNLNERFDVSPEKLARLKGRLERLAVDLGAVEERFIRGGGKGGQKINKTANCVQLSYPPLALNVRVQRDRRRTVNRYLALRELVDRIEMRLSPRTSGRLRELERLRRRKTRRADRSRRKYGALRTRPGEATGACADPRGTAPRPAGDSLLK